MKRLSAAIFIIAIMFLLFPVAQADKPLDNQSFTPIAKFFNDLDEKACLNEKDISALKEKIKRITKKVLQDHPDRYSSLIKDLQESLIHKKSPSLSERATALLELDTLTMFLSEFIFQSFMLTIAIPYFLSEQHLRSLSEDQVTAIKNKQFWSSLSCAALQSIIITVINRLQSTRLFKNQAEYATSSFTIIDHLHIWIIAFILQCANPTYNNNHVLRGNFSASTIGSLLTLPFVCHRIIKRGREHEKAHRNQAIKNNISMLIDQYEAALEKDE